MTNVASAEIAAVPDSLVKSNGVLSNEDTPLTEACTTLLGRFGLKHKTLSNYVNESTLQPPVTMTCAEFQSQILKKGSNGTFSGAITKSIRLKTACIFPKTTLEIQASNVIFDGGGSTFTGGTPDNVILGSGITFQSNDNNSVVPARNQTPIENVLIQKCNFENYSASGVFISNKFNRRNDADISFYQSILLPMHEGNTFDAVGEASPADILRQLSPKNISVRYITVRNTKNAAFYVQNSVTNVDFSYVKAMFTRSGSYLDFGTRGINIRNSCFFKVGYPDPRRKDTSMDRVGREAIAVDASASNNIYHNLFYKSYGGAVHLYKNCWESWENAAHDLLAQYPRRQSSDQNTILGNVIVGGKIGVSVAHRQWGSNAYSSTKSEDVVAHCGDRYINSFLKDKSASGHGVYTYRTYQDYAKDNRIMNNTFFNAAIPIRLNDDGNTVQANVFRGNASSEIVVVGSTKDLQYRGRAVINN